MEAAPCILISMLLLAGGITLIVWYTTVPEQPIFSIEQFYVPALDKTAATDPGTLNTTITFDLQIKNRGDAIYYDAVKATLYYGDYFGSPIASISMPGFRQGGKKTTHLIETVNIRDGVPWETAMEQVYKGLVPFRVRLSTGVKYTAFSRHSGRVFDFKLGGEVHVNYYGIMAGVGGIELTLLWSDDSVRSSLRQGPDLKSNVASLAQGPDEESNGTSLPQGPNKEEPTVGLAVV